MLSSLLTCVQAKLLEAAATFVKPGGALVYSSCSIEPEENADQISSFLSRHPDFTAEAPSRGLVPDSYINAQGYMQSLPHIHNMDGAFAARLRRAK